MSSGVVKTTPELMTFHLSKAFYSAASYCHYLNTNYFSSLEKSFGLVLNKETCWMLKKYDKSTLCMQKVKIFLIK